MFAGPALYAVIAACIFGAGSIAGWTVRGWEAGNDLAAMERRVLLADAANRECSEDIASAQAGIKQVTDALAAKEREAEAAMKGAKEEAQKRYALALKIKNAPIQAGETQCQAVEREQREYVEAMRDGN